MNTDDLLLNFLEGLQPWAKRELQRCQVNDISMALTEANTLVEFRKGESSKPKKDDNPQHGKNGRAKGDKSQHHDGKDKPQKKNGPKNGKKKAKLKHNFFLCDGGH